MIYDPAKHDGLAHRAVVRVTRLRPGHPDFQDAMQAARLAMVEAAQQWDPERGPWPPFARTCMWHALFQWYAVWQRGGMNGKRGRGKRRPRPDLGHLADEVAERCPGRDGEPDDELIRAETVEAVRRAVAKLPPEWRTVCEALMAGLTAEEAGALVGRTKGSMRHALYQRREQFREWFAAAA